MARLLHLSDLHVVAPGALASGVLDTRVLLRNAVDTVLERLEQLAPLDAVLVTGDISDDGTPESYTFARTELLRLGLPQLVIPGNHDRRDVFRSAFADLPGMPMQGLIDWVSDVGATRIVGVDTLLEGHAGGRVRPKSLRHLSEALAGAGDSPVIVALHHPPIRTGIRFMDEIGLANPDDLRSVVAAHNGPVRLLAGHVHGVYHGMLGPHPVSTAPSTCSAFRIDRRAEAPVGFMSGPLGCAIMDTVESVWTEILLRRAEGPFRF